MTSKIVVNNIEADAGVSTVTFGSDIQGNLIGNVNSTGITTFTDLRVGTAVTANSSGVQVGAGKSIRLYGATSGYSEIIAAAGSASTTFTLPANGGSASQYLQTDGSGVLSWQTVTDTGEVWTSNYQTASSASSVLWTGIPTDARELIITFSEWTHDTNSSVLCEIGTSGGLETSGYYQDQGYTGAGSAGSNNSSNPNWGNSGFVSTIYKFAGNIVLRKATSGDHWVIDWTCGGNYGYMVFVFGHKTLSGTLERVQVRQSAGNLSGNFALHYLT